MEGPYDMSETKVVQLFEVVDEQTMQIQHELNEPYLDSLSICMEILFHGEAQTELPLQIKEKVEPPMRQISIENYDVEDIHKAIQLAILKGMQKTTQHQHDITPETIALYIGY